MYFCNSVDHPKGPQNLNEYQAAAATNQWSLETYLPPDPAHGHEIVACEDNGSAGPRDVRWLQAAALRLVLLIEHRVEALSAAPKFPNSACKAKGLAFFARVSKNLRRRLCRGFCLAVAIHSHLGGQAIRTAVADHAQYRLGLKLALAKYERPVRQSQKSLHKTCTSSRGSKVLSVIGFLGIASKKPLAWRRQRSILLSGDWCRLKALAKSSELLKKYSLQPRPQSFLIQRCPHTSWSHSAWHTRCSKLHRKWFKPTRRMQEQM